MQLFFSIIHRKEPLLSTETHLRSLIRLLLMVISSEWTLVKWNLKAVVEFL